MKISFLTHHRGSLEVIQASTWNTYGSGGTRCSLLTWSQVSWSRPEHFRGCQSVPSILKCSLGCSEAILMSQLIRKCRIIIIHFYLELKQEGSGKLIQRFPKQFKCPDSINNVPGSFCNHPIIARSSPP